MKKIFVPLLVFLITTFFVIKVSALQENIGESVILIDAKTGYVIYQRNAHVAIPPASTTKILTAILALEKGKMTDVYTASQRAVFDIGNGGMNVGIMEGEEIPLEQLLNAMLIRSANETANIIAENIGGSIEEFALMMNEKAKEIGAKGTDFKNPSGKDTDRADEGHVTSTADLAMIAAYAMKIPEFREIVSKQTCTIFPTNKHSKEVILGTTNKLLFSAYKSDLFEPTGIKTGFTNKAGFNLVSGGINESGMELIGVVLGARNVSSSSVFSFSKELLEYGFLNYAEQEVISKDKMVKSIKVDEEENSDINILTKSAFKTIMPLEHKDWNISTQSKVKSLSRPIQKGASVGSLDVYQNGILMGSVELVAGNTIPIIEKKFTTVNVVSITLKIIAGIVIAVLAFITWLVWQDKPLRRKKVSDRRIKRLYMSGQAVYPRFEKIRNYRRTT